MERGTVVAGEQTQGSAAGAGASAGAARASAAAVRERASSDRSTSESRVAFTVLAPLAATRRRVGDVLTRAGLVSASPAALADGTRGAGCAVVVVDVRDGEGAAALRRLASDTPAPVLVALTVDDGYHAHVSALRHGAASAVPADASDHALLEAVRAALLGRCLLPREVAGRLCQEAETDRDAPELDDLERRILTRLAHGDSIRDIADALGYSERQMHRLASTLYEHLGASSRGEALVKAARAGLVEP